MSQKLTILFVFVLFRFCAGCEYGDHNPTDCVLRRTRYDCYYSAITRSNCCGTKCANPRVDLPGCEYGDKATWCAQMSRYQCYSVADTCCDLCANYRTGPPGMTPMKILFVNIIINYQNPKHGWKSPVRLRLCHPALQSLNLLNI